MVCSSTSGINRRKWKNCYTESDGNFSAFLSSVVFKVWVLYYVGNDFKIFIFQWPWFLINYCCSHVHLTWFGKFCGSQIQSNENNRGLESASSRESPFLMLFIFVSTMHLWRKWLITMCCAKSNLFYLDIHFFNCLALDIHSEHLHACLLMYQHIPIPIDFFIIPCFFA